MTTGDDDFRLRVGPPRSRRGPKLKRFVNDIRKARAKLHATSDQRLNARKPVPSPPSRGVGARLGRGHLAAKLAGEGLDPRARRVIVKTQLVRLQAVPHTTARHLRYLKRDATDRAGGPGELYDATSDKADGESFEQRAHADRHQFRIVVSPEDAIDIGDLKSFTREFMSQMERDLGTRLEWVAVDHWDTDDPHTHILLRGKADTRRDLIIAGNYIAHGMRNRARELATEWLGLRSEREIQAALNREVDQERWTSLDASLHEAANDRVVNLHESLSTAETRRMRALFAARLQRLDTMGLATRLGPDAWKLDAGLEQALRSMGERGDIIRSMQRQFTDQREFAILDARAGNPITGRVVSKGLVNELTDRGCLIVEGVDGRTHYVALSSKVDSNNIPVGAIVTARSGSAPRPADLSIASLARNGFYNPANHLAIARGTARAGQDPAVFVQTHVRRLEALRRAGIVEREGEGVWRIPPDLVERGQRFDARQADGATVDVHSWIPVDQQRRAVGATWLDQQLVRGTDSFAATGFGATVKDALAERRDFLVTQGFAERRANRMALARSFLETLRTRELSATANAIESELGRHHIPLINGARIAGVYRRSILLASGRFALIEGPSGFSLVPWRAVIEPRLGQSVSAVISGDYVSWDITRDRSPSR